jgi:hypothetical protein
MPTIDFGRLRLYKSLGINNLICISLSTNASQGDNDPGNFGPEGAISSSGNLPREGQAL